MPTGLFARDEANDRWVLSKIPESMKDYAGDHVELLVRYLREFTESEGPIVKARNP